MSRQILVTGGAGFLGSHLCDRLVGLGHDVVCADNFFTGSKRNVAQLLGHPRFELIRHDVMLPLYIEVDTIFNLACPASPIHYQRDPVQTVKTSVMGAINMLGLAKRTKAVLVQASTSEVYGDPEVHPQTEDYVGHVNPLGPRACYDEGKRCAETLCADYRRQHGVDARIVRIFNTYGPRMQRDDGRVVSNFIVAALQGRPLRVNGDGSQTRSFCYVDDLVDGLVAAMSAPAPWPGPVNLGNPEELSVRGLAEAIIAMTGSASVIEEAPLPHNDPRRRRPDIGLASRLLGFAPRTPRDAGLAATLRYFRELLAGEP